MMVGTPHVILLTGPAGAGKTTVAIAWAKSHRHPAVHFSIDTIRGFVKSGYANPEDGWNEETQMQYDLALGVCSMMTHEYVGGGYCCAIDDAVFPDWPDVGHGRWEAALGPIQHKLVVLLPIFERVVERNRTRTGRAHLKESTLQIIYDKMLAWRGYAGAILIDNGDLTVGETVEMIDLRLGS